VRVTLRVAAALTLALGIAALLGFFQLLGKGPFAAPEARHMRAMKDRRVAPAEVVPMALAAFATLPYRRPLAEYAPLERRGVVLEGYVKHMLRAEDGDMHLEFSADPPAGGMPYVTAEITPQWHRGHPHWSFPDLRAAFRSASGGEVTRWDQPARRVRLTGWLLYDYQFEPRRADLSRAPREQRESGWELHPVTKIEIWDDARGAYVEVRR
jgi:hypothetical protein